jgi:hypothetical protein
MLVIENLDQATFERAGTLVAREHAAARQVRPELPADFGSADVCAAALQRLCDGGHRGLVATDHGRTVAVMTATVRQHPAGGRYARLPADGFAVDPDLADPTGVLAVTFGDLASPLIADGVPRYYLLHPALPRLPEALSNLGFGRNGAYGIQPAAARRRSSAVAVRVAGVEHLDTVARLALIEVQHRSAPPMFAPPHAPPAAFRKGRSVAPANHSCTPRSQPDARSGTMRPRPLAHLPPGKPSVSSSFLHTNCASPPHVQVCVCPLDSVPGPGVRVAAERISATPRPESPEPKCAAEREPPVRLASPDPHVPGSGRSAPGTRVCQG